MKKTAIILCAAALTALLAACGAEDGVVTDPTERPGATAAHTVDHGNVDLSPRPSAGA